MWNTRVPVLSKPDIAHERVRAMQDEARTEQRSTATPPAITITEAGALVPIEPELTLSAARTPDGRGLGNQHPGPNPYERLDRQLTDAGSFLFTFNAKDDRAWVWWLKFAAWALGAGTLGWVLLQPPLAEDHIWKAGLWTAAAYFGWRLLFDDDGHPCTIEVWSDCFVVDGTEIFWRSYLELGWPTLVSVGENAWALAGTYGTRYVEFCRIHAFDEHDRGPQVFLAQVQFVMQQMWSDPT